MPDRTFATDLTHLPRLMLTSDDHDRLTALARATASHDRDGAQLLMGELYLADIVPHY